MDLYNGMYELIDESKEEIKKKAITYHGNKDPGEGL